MGLYKLNIGDKKLKVAVANTEETLYQGLSGTKRLGKNKGMLFMFPKPSNVTMVMRDMNYDLDFVMLDSNWEVIQVGSLDKDDRFGITALMPPHMVLELNKGDIDRLGIRLGMTLNPEKDLSTQLKGVQKFKHGGRFEMVGEKVFEVKVDDIKVDPNKLQILNTDGEVVANIEPGARIFSREDTKRLISKHKNGDKLALAEAMIEMIDRQDNQKQEYVTK